MLVDSRIAAATAQSSASASLLASTVVTASTAEFVSA